ncbi:MAG: hypothetical protein UHN88_04955 [Eubacterium sp.]|nr:hypothetical protein [Eubacterium sp.]
MRYLKFKMEREGLLTEEQKVTIIESQLPTSYYYTIVPSVAMSKNYPPYERMMQREGTVKCIEDTPRGFYVIVEVDEKPVEGEESVESAK